MSTYQYLLLMAALAGLALAVWLTPAEEPEMPSFARGMGVGVGLVVAIVSLVLLVLEFVLP